jgi:hypothetical protein
MQMMTRPASRTDVSEKDLLDQGSTAEEEKTATNLTPLRRTFEQRIDAKHDTGRQSNRSLTSRRSSSPHTALVIVVCLDCQTCSRQQREEEVERFKPKRVLRKPNKG